MAYVKTTWQTGDVITAAKLNNMEDGIEDASSHFITVDLSNENWSEADQVYSIDLGIENLSDNVFAGKIYSVILPDLTVESNTLTGLKLLSVYDTSSASASFVPNYIPENVSDFGYSDGAWYFDFTK